MKDEKMTKDEIHIRKAPSWAWRVIDELISDHLGSSLIKSAADQMFEDVEVVMQPVVSSNIAAVGFREFCGLMVVQFKNGSIYQYDNVTPELYHEIVNADSVGSTFNRVVKSNPTAYPFTKLI